MIYQTRQISLFAVECYICKDFGPEVEEIPDQKFPNKATAKAAIIAAKKAGWKVGKNKMSVRCPNHK